MGQNRNRKGCCLVSMKEIYEKIYNLKLKALPEGAKYEVGKTYFCGYWRQIYEVLEYQENVPIWGWEVTVKWQDGRVRKHSTALMPGQDFEVIKEESGC